MKKNKTIIQKFNGLIKSKVPRFLHHYGPKKYTTWQHIKCLLLKEKLRTTYRGLMEYLPYFRVKDIPHYTTLQKFASRIPIWIWNLILRLTNKIENCLIGAIDSTGFNKYSASNYYLQRINKNPHNKWIKLSIYVDILRRKILSAKVRAKPAHDTKDVAYLIKQSKCLADTNLMDKGYDSEKIHTLFRERNVKTIIPTKKNAIRGRYREEMMKSFPKKKYNQRSIVEAMIGAIKRRFGSCLRSRSYRTQRSELYIRLILYNISLAKARLFLQRRLNRKV